MNKIACFQAENQNNSIKVIAFVFAFLGMSVGIFGQRAYGTISGRVSNEKGEPLPFANIILKENNNGVASDKNGFYKITASAGIYTVEVSFIGYEKVIEKITIYKNKILERNYYLKSKSFEIGSIEVIAEGEFIPIDPITKTKVTSGEIQHIQASSLNDVMELTPGVKTTNPTLNSVEHASIRGGDPLGTQIILDGIPVSNNANLQEGIGLSSSTSGVDLRSIPAENIKEVEVIRGIPSAQYGDLIDGLLLVKTKASAHSPLLKLKYNPNVYETNLSGGIKFRGWILNGNLNVASSDRDFRVKGDGYTRIAAQITAEYERDNFDFKNIIYATRTIDEKKEEPGYARRDSWYNRDLNIKYTGNFIYEFDNLSSLNTKVSVSYTNRDSYSQSLISRDNIVVSDRLTEGVQEGHIVFGTYLGKKWIKGGEWNIFADANYKFRFFTGKFLNSWLTGITYRNEFNNGEGIIFDPLYPPSVSTTSPRIRTYDEIPHHSILSLYLEDKITGRLFRPFTLQLGVRYEVYRPGGINIDGLWGKDDFIESRNGSFLNPRINFSYNLFESMQIRMSYGVTTKSPPMGMIFAQDHYFDIVDTNSVVDPQNPEKNFSLISTYIRKEANPELKAYEQKKYEISIDQQVGFVGFTLTGYRNKSDNMFTKLDAPMVLNKYSFPDWPNTSTVVPKDTLIYTYDHYTNFGWQNTAGLEFSFRTRQIPVINTVFKFDAAYNRNQRGTTEDYYIFSGERFLDDLGITVIPMYNNYTESTSKDLLLNYRFEIQTKSLGMWITIHFQQQLIEIDSRNNFDDTLAIGYFTKGGDLIRIPENERNNIIYTPLKRRIEPFELLDENRPNIWLINLKVSKALWKGAAVSFFVNNFLNNRPLYMEKRKSPSYPNYQRRNPSIFYGIEFHSAL